jgi:hypothetical protein
MLLIAYCGSGEVELVRAAQAHREQAKHAQREQRRFLHQEVEPRLIDADEFAVGLRARERRARRTVDDGHLAEDAVGSHDFDDVTGDHQLDLARTHDEHAVAGVTLGENRHA